MKTLTCTVPAECDGMMIKRILRVNLSVSHRQLSDLKNHNGMLLNGVPVHANAVVHTGQTVTALLEAGAEERGINREEGPVCIVYEDEDLLVIDKSAPLACQSSSRQPDNTLENRLMYYFRDLPGYTFRPVNRLDKGTSGLMVVAKHAHAQTLLSKQLHTPRFVRRYMAVVEGHLPEKAGTIDLPIGKEKGASIRRVIDPEGRLSVTHYEVLSETDARSLVRLTLETGRTHQIRVHLSAMGCPVWGDFLYGREDPALPERFALHSCHLEIDHPLDAGKRLVFDSELPEALRSLILR